MIGGKRDCYSKIGSKTKTPLHYIWLLFRTQGCSEVRTCIVLEVASQKRVFGQTRKEQKNPLTEASRQNFYVCLS